MTAENFPPTFLVCSLQDMLNSHAERLEASLQKGGVRNVCVRKELGTDTSIIERRPALFFLGHISPIFAPLFLVFSRFSPS